MATHAHGEKRIAGRVANVLHRRSIIIVERAMAHNWRLLRISLDNDRQYDRGQ